MGFVDCKYTLLGSRGDLGLESEKKQTSLNNRTYVLGVEGMDHGGLVAFWIQLGVWTTCSARNIGPDRWGGLEYAVNLDRDEQSTCEVIPPRKFVRKCRNKLYQLYS